MQTPGNTALELQQAILDHFKILEEDGAVCLRARSDTATSRTAATITVEEKCPVHGAIVDDLHNNLNLPSQASPHEISAAELEEEEDQNNAPESSEHSFSDESAYDLFEYHHSQADDYSMSDPYDSHSATDNYPMLDPYDSSAAGEYLMSDPYNSNNGYGSGEESKDLSRKFPILSIPIAPSRNSKSTMGPEEQRPKKGKDDYYCNSLSFPAASSLSTFPPPPKADPKGMRKQRQADFSKSISAQWKALPPEEWAKWEKLAHKKKHKYEALHLVYVYWPMRGRRKSSALAFGSAFATIPTAPVLTATSFASTPAVPASPSHLTWTSLEFVVPAHHTSAGNFTPQLALFAPHHTKPAKSAFSPGHGEIVMLARPDHAFLSPDPGLLRSSSDAMSWWQSHV
ncbi:Repressor ROX1 [Mycena sanguinolenta]|uniref:Repressor ROX1 n=1 Tax=Mycena sanguinolenta TaxID=230812 RepID=A0A8H6ZBG1_9AGAR|nr:Repressor ROX1 [Mycena sanguinolenta]